MEKLNKKALADIIANDCDLSKKKSVEIVDKIFDCICDQIKNSGQVDITGLGKFSVKEKNERVRTNPKTKEKITIKGGRSLNFKVSSVLKDELKK